ncbi:MAG: hypothetical protein K2X66_17280, partial [Cyanobacteria bacterium]|nr:hypothetical protein [Cyanobacteriota bacterium]
MTSSTANKMEFETQGRFDFLNINNESAQYLQAFREVFSQHSDEVIDAFYNHATQYPNLKSMFGPPENIARLKKAQISHWMTLFEGTFAQNYMDKVNRVGAVHKVQGLEPRWYIGGYAFAVNALIGLCFESFKGDPARIERTLQEVIKAVFLDMDLVISMYFGSILSEIKENADTVKVATVQLNATSEQMETTATELMAVSNSTAEATEALDANIKNVAAAVEESSSSIQLVYRTSEDVARSINIVDSASTQMSNNMQNIASAVEEMSSSVNTVAAAVAEMSTSLNEVSQNATQAASVASKAESAAEKTKDTVDMLGASAKEIDNV